MLDHEELENRIAELDAEITQAQEDANTSLADTLIKLRSQLQTEEQITGEIQ